MIRALWLARSLRLAGVVAVAVAVPQPAIAEECKECRVLEVSFTPSTFTPPTDAVDFPSQIVVWIERRNPPPATDSEFVQTIYITQQTGRFGIGNRPGRLDFNSGPLWPYGRREGVFPIWAHRHVTAAGFGALYPKVVFRNENENALSHSLEVSSKDHHFCRPLMSTGNDKAFWDAGTCATGFAATDKGKLSASETSLYPPRADLTTAPEDLPDVDLYSLLNTYDSVTRATAEPGTNTIASFAIAPELPLGDYEIFVEVSKEFDHNATYSAAARPSPVVAYGTYGLPYRGQPSVVYKLPFRIGDGEGRRSTLDYAGYSDPDGIDGTLRAPDGTITTDVIGSGGSRLQLMVDDVGMFRVRADITTERDCVQPAAPGEFAVVNAESGSTTISFVAPGDDGMDGTAREYQIRYRVGEDITDANFLDATPLDGVSVVPDLAGLVQMLDMRTLLPATEYTLAIRAIDNCMNAGPIATLRFTTAVRKLGEVDACFIATAAYGSAMAEDVGMLRRFRDAMLRNSVLGELVVESYYTFGPAVAGVIGESELLRATARGALTPVLGWVRIFGIAP